MANIVLYPGGYKPPHIGHYKAAKQDVDVEAQKGVSEAAEYEEYKVEFDQDGTEAGADAIDEIIQKEIIEESSLTKK